MPSEAHYQPDPCEIGHTVDPWMVPAFLLLPGDGRNGNPHVRPGGQSPGIQVFAFEASDGVRHLARGQCEVQHIHQLAQSFANWQGAPPGFVWHRNPVGAILRPDEPK